MEPPRNMFEKEFWLELRTKTSIHGSLGINSCDSWCDDVFTNIPEMFHCFLLRRTNYDSKLLRAKRLIMHQWIEVNGLGKIFVADGTAGQIVESYANGFYDFFENVPRAMKSLYS